MNSPRYLLPEVQLGVGCTSEAVCHTVKGHHLALVLVDRKGTPLERRVGSCLESMGVSYDVQPTLKRVNPEGVDKLSSFIAMKKYDIVIACGTQSINSAKICLAFRDQKIPKEFDSDFLNAASVDPSRKTKLIVIPTSVEIYSSTSITCVWKNNRRIFGNSSAFRPDAMIIDSYNLEDEKHAWIPDRVVQVYACCVLSLSKQFGNNIVPSFSLGTVRYLLDLVAQNDLPQLDDASLQKIMQTACVVGFSLSNIDSCVFVAGVMISDALKLSNNSITPGQVLAGMIQEAAALRELEPVSWIDSDSFQNWSVELRLVSQFKFDSKLIEEAREVLGTDLPPIPFSIIPSCIGPI